MSKQEDILAGDFGLTDEVAPVAKSADAETLVTRLEDRFSDSMTLLKRIPVTLTLEVSSVEIMLADLLNIDDDTVIELDKLAGEPLDIKVNNILLGKAEVVVVNEKYGVSKDELAGPKRNKEIAAARHICIFLIRELTEMSFPSIGKLFQEHSVNTRKRSLFRCNPPSLFREKVHQYFLFTIDNHTNKYTRY